MPRPTPLTSPAPAATVLAFDFGTRRIGVAVGNTLVRGAHALATGDVQLVGADLMGLKRQVQREERAQAQQGEQAEG